MKALDRAKAKHQSITDANSKLRDKRDKALDTLIRAESRYRAGIKAIARSGKRLDKLREEERLSKAARKEAKAQCEKETPDIAAILGV